METIAALVLGLAIGGIVGALAMLAVKGKKGDGEAELLSKLEAATSSLEEANRISAEHKRDADEQRAQAIEQGKEIVQLQTRFESTQTQYESIDSENTALNEKVEQWRKQAMENNDKSVKLHADLDAANKRLAERISENTELKEQVEEWCKQAMENNDKSVKLHADLDAANKRLAERTDIEKVLGDQFKVMANDALTQNSDAFAKTADEKIGALLTQAKSDFSHSKDAVQDLVKPLSDELKRIEEARNKSQGSLTQQIAALMENSTKLGDEARNLTNALKRPEVRGSWGEMQLRRVVELSGMANYCDFEEQVSVRTAEGTNERPDMVVRMPNERTIVVDAKAPLTAYLQVINADTEQDRNAAAEKVSQQVSERAKDLAKKSYWASFETSPDFVVMFLPGEFLLPIALEKTPELLEQIMEQRVVIATPNTLMALLKTVAMGWREARLAEEAEKIGKLGQELHDKLYTFAEHMNKTRNSLNTTVGHFNKGIGSLEGKNSVFDHARRFKELGISSSREIREIPEVDTQVRQINSFTMRALPEANIAGDD